MRKEAKMILIFILLMAAFLDSPAKAEVNITVTTDGDVDVTLDTNGDGALLSIDYNGRDLLKEIEEKTNALASLQTAMIFLANQRDIERVEKEIEALEEALKELIMELNSVFRDVYFKLSMQAHIIGINPGNTSVSVILISGNRTIADFIQENADRIAYIEQELDMIDARITSLDQEIHAILDEQEQAIEENRDMIQKIQDYLTARQEYIDEQLTDIDGKFMMTYTFIGGTIIIVLIFVYVQGASYKKLSERLKLLELEPEKDISLEESTPT